MGTKATPDRVFGILSLVLSTYVCVKSRQLGLGDLHKPGSGFLPFCAGASLGILALLMIARTLTTGTYSAVERGETNYRAVALVVVALVGYTVCLEPLGFIVATAIFVGLLLKLIEKKRWLPTVCVSLIVALGSYFIFAVLLQSELPRGIQALFGL